ncbi:molybdopterin-synthase adenylyltransferase MoeB [Brevundimonas sp. PAMC22021]|uniref:HesA/MoeB/ThiF family protein n=1 Tax=Brevundimonas sp. PAMC22021 TaxID=2861285 RepID=UPI001C638471|nr:molybdopterin-synthase adenylyltransferase MoeB [Brevundimonas sp. PAMC22021]QYF86870.1 molybdopterin-synthase adenylyltransferase MoeB [Brevundimonas sp. PAMC22021]
MPFSDDEVERYARHLVLREVGGPGQQRLARARVLIVGAGGVGSPAALYLAAAGVGTLGLIDEDVVSLSNLQRQVLFDTADQGRLKVEAGAERLSALNPHVEVRTFPERLTVANAAAVVGAFDLVLDGTDDFETRLLVNRACVAAGKPLVSGALGRWSGQIGVFAGRPCYQCLVPEIPPDAETCARVGVIGALAGVIGTLAALETIKIITGAGEPLTGRLMLYDGLAGEARTVRVAADPTCPVCGQP